MKRLAAAGLPADVQQARVNVTTGAGRPFHEDIGRLQGEFVRRIDRYLFSRKRRMIGWDEILEGGLHADSSAMPMVWRSMDAVALAVAQKRDVVVCVHPDYYLDNDSSVASTYALEPVPAAFSAEQERHVLGLQGNMWGESTPKIEDVYRRTFPRLTALSEVAWSPRELRDFADFEQRLKQHAPRLAKFGVTIA